MAGAGKKTFQVNEVLSAADVNQYLMDQSVMRFADSSARSSAIGTPSEGMVSYLDDTDQVEVYDGSQWVNFTGDITQITAGTALTGGGTAGNVTLDVDISALATAQAGTALTASGETLNVDETELFTGGTAGYTALSNGTAGLSYQPVSHNYIINGAFDIWQRGTSFTGLTTDVYTADRWRYSDSDATTTITRETFTPADIEAVGFGDAEYFLRYNITSGDANNSLQNIIEDVRTLAGQTVTLSFWAKADADIDVDPYFVQDFGSGGSSSVVTGNADARTITTSWQRFTKTINLPSVSGKTIGTGSYLYLILLPAGSGTPTIDYWGVQLEAGSIATPFKRHAPSLQGELAACQRYYYRIQGASQPIGPGSFLNTSRILVYVQMPVQMRATPTFSDDGGTNNMTAFVSNTGDGCGPFEASPQRASNKYLFLDLQTGVAAKTINSACQVECRFAASFVEFDAEL